MASNNMLTRDIKRGVGVIEKKIEDGVYHVHLYMLHVGQEVFMYVEIRG